MLGLKVIEELLNPWGVKTFNLALWEGGGSGGSGNFREKRTARQRRADTQSQEIDNKLKELQLRERTQKSREDLRQADIEQGRRFAQDVLGPEGLGRLSDRGDIQDIKSRFGAQRKEAERLAREGANIRDISDPTQRGRFDDLESRLQNIADQGLSREEVQAQRELAFGGINRATQTASRRAQALLARSGVKGAVAGRQLLDVELAGAEKKSDVEKELFLESEAIRRQALGDLSQFTLKRGGLSLSAQKAGAQRDVALEAANQARRQAAGTALSEEAGFTAGLATFDLGQAAKEKNIVLQSGLGFAEIGQAERSAQAQADATRQQSIGCFPAGQMVKMADGELKRIENLVPGDEVAAGGKVLIAGWAREKVIYKWDDLLITGTHAIHDGKGWTEAQHVLDIHDVHPKGIKVYNVVTENHKLIVSDKLVGDWFEPKDIDGLRGWWYNLKSKWLKKLKDF